MKVGLRFRRSSRRQLRELLVRAERRELAEARTLFAAALEATEAGEPMHLECVDLEEARKVAQGFPRYGVVEPTIEPMEDEGLWRLG